MPRAVFFSGGTYLLSTSPAATVGSGVVSYWYRASVLDKKTAIIFMIDQSDKLIPGGANLIVWHDYDTTTAGLTPGVYLHLDIVKDFFTYAQFESVTPIPYDGKWHNIWVCWDVLNIYGGQYGVARLQVDNTFVNWHPNLLFKSNTSFDINYGNLPASVGALFFQPDPLQTRHFFIGDLAEIYVDLNNDDYGLVAGASPLFPQGWLYTDAVGQASYTMPARLGDNGDAPFGRPCTLYLHGDEDHFPGSFAVNGPVSQLVTSTSDPFSR